MTEIVLYGEVGWDFDASWLDRALDDADGDDVTLLVHSPGGDVFEGVAINSVIARHRRDGQRVDARVEGLAASAASYMCAACDEVSVAPGGSFMVHEPWALCQGPASDMRRTADALDSCRDSIVDILCRRTGRAPSEVTEAMRDETWLSGREAVEWGLADSVDGRETDGERTLAAERWSSLPESAEYAAFCQSNPACMATLGEFSRHARDFASAPEAAAPAAHDTPLTVPATADGRDAGEAPDVGRGEAPRLFSDGRIVCRIDPREG